MVLGLAALVLLLVCKKLIPKFPMAVLLMIAGAGMTYLLPIEDWGVQTLASVDTGLPHWAVPDFSVISIREAVTISLSVAVVIMAETLLAENNFAQKNGYRINDNQRFWHFQWGISLRHLPAVVRSMARYQEQQWENSIRQRHSLPVS